MEISVDNELSNLKCMVCYAKWMQQELQTRLCNQNAVKILSVEHEQFP